MVRCLTAPCTGQVSPGSARTECFHYADSRLPNIIDWSKSLTETVRSNIGTAAMVQLDWLSVCFMKR